VVQRVLHTPREPVQFGHNNCLNLLAVHQRKQAFHPGPLYGREKKTIRAPMATLAAETNQCSDVRLICYLCNIDDPKHAAKFTTGRITA
jgi:hypothetical protein